MGGQDPGAEGIGRDLSHWEAGRKEASDTNLCLAQGKGQVIQVGSLMPPKQDAKWCEREERKQFFL